MTDPRLDDLRRNIPGLRLETDPAELEHYGRDWTRRWTPAPLAVALPADVEQVQEIGRAHVCTPVTNAQLVCRLLLDKKQDESTQQVNNTQIRGLRTTTHATR